jgi:hypothetical protein
VKITETFHVHSAAYDRPPDHQGRLQLVEGRLGGRLVHLGGPHQHPLAKPGTTILQIVLEGMIEEDTGARWVPAPRSVLMRNKPLWLCWLLRIMAGLEIHSPICAPGHRSIH